VKKSNLSDAVKFCVCLIICTQNQTFRNSSLSFGRCSWIKLADKFRSSSTSGHVCFYNTNGLHASQQPIERHFINLFLRKIMLVPYIGCMKILDIIHFTQYMENIHIFYY